MIFAEKKLDNGFEYTCEDVFGEAVFTVPEKLDGDTLDALISFLLKQPMGKEVRGSVEYKSGQSLTYVFKPKALWEKDQEEICKITNDTSTSILERVSAFIVTPLSRIRRAIINWLWRFVGSRLESMKQKEERRDKI